MSGTGSDRPTAPLSVRAYVDWDNDRLFDGPDEDVTARTRIDRPFTGVRGRDQIRMLAPPMAGSSSAVLDNESRDYSPENVASPLYEALLPGRLVKHEAVLWTVGWEAEIQADRPTGWWRGDVVGSSILDSSGNLLHGTYAVDRFGTWEGMNDSGLTWEALNDLVGETVTWEQLIYEPLAGATGGGGIGGSSNGSIVLLGTEGRVILPDSELLAFDGALTIETWIRTTQTATASLFQGYDPEAPHHGYGLRISAGLLGFYTDTGGWIDATGPEVNDGAWHHVVARYDGLELVLFVDGVAVLTEATTPPTAWRGRRSIGAVAVEAGEEAFNGNVDELAVYDFALPAFRVLAHYGAGTPSPYRSEILADSPSGWWRLDETVATAGATVADSSGNGQNGATTGTVTPVLPGALHEHTGGAFRFGPGAGSVSIPHDASLGGTTFTVEAWIYLESYGDPAQFRHILSKEGGGRNYGLWLTAGTDAALHWSFQTAALGFNSFTTLFQFRLLRWYHLAIVYEAGTDLFRLYVDGDLLHNESTIGGDPYAAIGPLILGSGTAATNFPGLIDEVAVYDQVLSGARLRAHHQAGMRGRYPLSLNLLDDLPQQPEWEQRTASLPAIGTLSILRRAKVSTALYQNIRTDDAFDVICDAAGIPKDMRVVHTGASTLLWWWLNDEFPWDAAMKLLNTEGPGAAVYEDAEGRLVFEGRQYRLAHPRSTTVQATYADSVTAPWRLESLDYNPGLKHVVNDISLSVNVRAVEALQVIYSRGAAFTIGSGETFRIKVTGSGGDPFTGAVTPIAGTDFTITTGSVAAVTLDRTSGGNATVSITAGGGGAAITGFQVRAQPVGVTNEIFVSNNADASESLARYGLQSFPHAIWPELDYLVAQDFCDAIVNAYKEPRPYVRVQTVPSVGGTTGRQALNRQISDRIAILDTQLATAIEAFVETIEYRYEGFRFVTVLGCEKAAAGDYAVWGDAQWDLSKWGY